jgi:hypothetical protein
VIATVEGELYKTLSAIDFSRAKLEMFNELMKLVIPPGEPRDV